MAIRLKENAVAVKFDNATLEPVESRTRKQLRRLNHMPYLKPEHQGSEQLERFCRKCGARIETSIAKGIGNLSPKDPDELTGNGIGAVIVGDGLMMVAVILSATQTSVSSLLWLLLLIPAFFFFGKGFADVLHARQIRRRIKQAAPNYAANLLPASQVSVTDVLNKSISGELATVPSVTERTTRNL
jgi:hypothetical protein